MSSNGLTHRNIVGVTSTLYREFNHPSNKQVVVPVVTRHAVLCGKEHEPLAVYMSIPKIRTPRHSYGAELVGMLNSFMILPELEYVNFPNEAHTSPYSEWNIYYICDNEAAVNNYNNLLLTTRKDYKAVAKWPHGTETNETNISVYHNMRTAREDHQPNAAINAATMYAYTAHDLKSNSNKYSGIPALLGQPAIPHWISACDKLSRHITELESATHSRYSSTMVYHHELLQENKYFLNTVWGCSPTKFRATGQ
jgi:hypothetical protein